VSLFQCAGGDPLSLLINLMAFGFECSKNIEAGRHPSEWEYLRPDQLIKLAENANTDIQKDLVCRRVRPPMDFLSH
jgi:hypothetical protein